MENQIQIFSNPEFGTIRTILLDGEIWFVAADVCRALDIQNPRDTVAKVLTDNEKGCRYYLHPWRSPTNEYCK